MKVRHQTIPVPEHIGAAFWYTARAFPLLLFFFFLPALAHAQKKTRIDILYSEILQQGKQQEETFKRLIGNVKLKHEDAIMSCDSAHLFDIDKEVQAFGSIHVNQGDTLHLYGDFMKYRGDTRLAQVRRNVRLVDKETELETMFLDFDMNRNIGYFFNRGTIRNADNTLKSSKGYYYSKTKDFYFKDSVEIVNPDYTISCDTLRYNTSTETAFFLSPTIIRGEDLFIYCENGWYDTRLDLSQFNENAFIVTGDKMIRGDSIFYDRVNGIGIATGHIELTDTTQKIILRGNYAESYENPEQSLVTDSALFIQYAEGDTLFMAADTLWSVTDTAGFRLLRAFYNVRIFRDDLQAICDSLSYSFSDSVIQLYHKPVLWSDENQLTANFVRIITRNQKVHLMEMFQSSFIVSMEDSLRYNQLKGKDMVAHFIEGELYMIRVTGNGQTLYYARDNEEIIGINKAESSNIDIYVKDRKIERIRMLTEPGGNFTPPSQASPAELKLDGFNWHEPVRPAGPDDLFRKNRGNGE